MQTYNFLFFFKLLIGFAGEYRRNGKWFFLSSLFLCLSKIFQTASFFIPLKVLIILSSGNVPDYVGGVLSNIEYGRLVIFLALMIPASYFCYIFFGILYRWFFDRDSQLHWKSEYSCCGVLVKGKDLRVLHGQISRLFSEALLITMCLMLLIPFSALIFWVVLFVICLLFSIFNAKVFGASEDERLSYFRLHRRQFIEYSISCIFVLFFGILAANVYLGSIGMYGSIFILLTVRLCLQSLQRASVEMIYIKRLIS
ncbi:hypothetical protein QC820_11450 [Halomonas mongoliensis]|uniref:Uncharacterized protein n=1 Tax=Halomonas mongoliensis TaxID=321265 RepID=A0ABU1GNM0_9GAMM|nr:hypothetical protein [Halomonas mongoliensis]MDR5893425.1 hypothetical protein [Halomonas mongoliensis]